MRLPSLLGLFILLPVQPSHVASAGGIPIGLPAQEWTQIANHVQLAMQYERQAEEIYNQIRMIRMMTREGLNLEMFPDMAMLVIGDIEGMRTLVKESEGLSYGLAANDKAFRDTYQGYAQSTQPYFTRYNGWATNTLNTALGAARTAGMQQDAVWNEQKFNRRLQSMMSTPQGTDQTLEKANVLSFSMLRQMQNLRSLMAADMQSKAAFNGYQISKEQAVENSSENAGAYVSRDVDHSQYGYVPGQN